MTVTAVNPLYNASATLTIRISKAVAGIAITDYGIVGKKNNKQFTISFEDVGDDSCIILDWGDAFEKV